MLATPQVLLRSVMSNMSPTPSPTPAPASTSLSNTAPTPAPAPIPEYLAKYRDLLIAADQKAQEEFDKAVLSLSGGALGVSLVFLKDVIGSDPIGWPSLLMAAWVCWAFSTLFVLVSYHLSHKAIRASIQQIDDGDPYAQKFGGDWAVWTARLNVWGATLFVAGVLFITSFACVNLSAKGTKNVDKSASSPASPAGTSTGHRPQGLDAGACATAPAPAGTASK